MNDRNKSRSELPGPKRAPGSSPRAPPRLLLRIGLTQVSFTCRRSPCRLGLAKAPCWESLVCFQSLVPCQAVRSLSCLASSRSERDASSSGRGRVEPCEKAGGNLYFPLKATAVLALERCHESSTVDPKARTAKFKAEVVRSCVSPLWRSRTLVLFS